MRSNESVARDILNTNNLKKHFTRKKLKEKRDLKIYLTRDRPTGNVTHIIRLSNEGPAGLSKIITSLLAVSFSS